MYLNSKSLSLELDKMNVSIILFFPKLDFNSVVFDVLVIADTVITILLKPLLNNARCWLCTFRMYMNCGNDAWRHQTRSLSLRGRRRPTSSSSVATCSVLKKSERA